MSNTTHSKTHTDHIKAVMPAPQQTPSVGRIVHYVLSGGKSEGEHRPAIIVRVWPVLNDVEMVQLQVFTDCANDYQYHAQPGASGLLWATSVHQDEETKKPGTWHWPEPIPAK